MTIVCQREANVRNATCSWKTARVCVVQWMLLIDDEHPHFDHLISTDAIEASRYETKCSHILETFIDTLKLEKCEQIDRNVRQSAHCRESTNIQMADILRDRTYVYRNISSSPLATMGNPSE
ncbi:hypothetical protein KIN20_010119 [Parelaphostrongylus tenuis]|uniref:Uncharacterized protein n=1 Tax=Parelaphostrongylus tenuis TaxID=148309 RepID=A0AAD5M955_PARTN|nr:hypothetical protein KIN20_010119 [Parelaphostrongylus tenuis]